MGRTSSNRSLVAVAVLHEGQYKSEARSAPNCEGSASCGCGFRGVPPLEWPRLPGGKGELNIVVMVLKHGVRVKPIQRGYLRFLP